MKTIDTLLKVFEVIAIVGGIFYTTTSEFKETIQWLIKGETWDKE